MPPSYEETTKDDLARTLLRVMGERDQARAALTRISRILGKEGDELAAVEKACGKPRLNIIAENVNSVLYD